ncbi:hypothetical protein B5E41_03060 [Rhizobium esperanzae]|uniref:Uncharacterized protein n=1 Tax=Rhizobium esperanzae TaxID=1967781 RepID=A0A246E0B2_9HYPH|nr:hypothetical protein B5E41_03060 [Rhizobium esperanzae]
MRSGFARQSAKRFCGIAYIQKVRAVLRFREKLNRSGAAPKPSPYGDLTGRAFASPLFAKGEGLILSAGMLELRSGARVENPDTVSPSELVRGNYG